jgi:hypothetical protein
MHDHSTSALVTTQPTTIAEVCSAYLPTAKR